MLYRTMPRTGDRVSILGFGCMRLPLNAEGGIDGPRATALIRSAIDRGVNYVDTAWGYHDGESEPASAARWRTVARGPCRTHLVLVRNRPTWNAPDSVSACARTTSTTT